MGAIEKIKTMIEQEIAARDAVSEQIAATNDPVQIAGLVAEYGARCAAIGAFMAAIDEIEKEANE
jgi:hypothetical protein